MGFGSDKASGLWGRALLGLVVAVLMGACSPTDPGPRWIDVYGGGEIDKYIIFQMGIDDVDEFGNAWFDPAEVNYAMSDEIEMPAGCKLRLWLPTSRPRVGIGRLTLKKGSDGFEFAMLDPRREAICGIGNVPTEPDRH